MVTKPKTFLEVVEKNTCRYIDKNDEFCGELRLMPSMYCAAHFKVCHKKDKPNRMKGE